KSNSLKASGFALKGTRFVFTRSSSEYFDEDGHLAHEFYRESNVKSKKGKYTLKRITKGLYKQFRAFASEQSWVQDSSLPQLWPYVSLGKTLSSICNKIK
uniref:uncharacterized protein LOC101241928 n=1 Tax=Ciona intestinalis TaxID=7719 RepID=UPI000EF4B912